MKYGISTACMYPLETEKAFAAMLEAGYRIFEVACNTSYEMDKDYLKEIKAMADAYGAQIVSIHPYTSPFEGNLLFGDYTRRTYEAMELYKRFGETAAFLGGRYVIIHGQRADMKILPDEGYWERFGELTRCMRDTGAIPLQENVRYTRARDLEFLQGMKEYLKDEVGFVLDVKQSRCIGTSIEETARVMGERLFHVHISDATEKETCLLPGTGNYDFGKFRELMQDIGYKGVAVTEVYSQAFHGVEDLEKSLEWLRDK